MRSKQTAAHQREERELLGKVGNEGKKACKHKNGLVWSV